MWIKRIFLLTLISLVLLVINAAEKNVIIGVLEDIPGKFAGEKNTRAVRVVFEKNGGEWRAFPSDCSDVKCLELSVTEYPSEGDWTIAFNGQALGRVTSRAEKVAYYCDIGLQNIVSTGSIPTIGTRSDEFATWASNSLYRPLIAVSQPNVNDPEHWKPTQVSSALIIQLHRQFRQKYSTLCTFDKDENKKAFNYRDDDITLGKAYESNKDWILAELHLKDAVTCNAEFPLVGIDCWFIVDPRRKIRALDVEGRLVDAGDYDNDGTSELVFQTDGYNRNGYVMFYDDFKKNISFEFSYH